MVDSETNPEIFWLGYLLYYTLQKEGAQKR